jgi:ABC-2 type transport system permease protein
VASTSNPPSGAPAPVSGSGSIYDLGYRHYEGARLGRRHAILVLYIESLRGAFGLGRSAVAKIAPALLIFFALIPAFVQLMISALIDTDAGDILRHDEYYEVIKFLLGLYCAAVAPDIAGRDQRNRSLTLYFSRAIKRGDYAFAKLAAMTTAMLMITLGPQLLLLVANGLVANDFGAYLREEWDVIFPIVGTAFLGSAVIASIGIFIAAQTPRRAFATVGIIVAFIIPIAVAGLLVVEIDTAVTRYAIFASPLDVVTGFTSWMFQRPPAEGETVDVANFEGWTYLVAAAVMIIIATGLVIRRYRTVRT